MDLTNFYLYFLWVLPLKLQWEMADIHIIMILWCHFNTFFLASFSLKFSLLLEHMCNHWYISFNSFHIFSFLSSFFFIYFSLGGYFSYIFIWFYQFQIYFTKFCEKYLFFQKLLSFFYGIILWITTLPLFQLYEKKRIKYHSSWSLICLYVFFLIWICCLLCSYWKKNDHCDGFLRSFHFLLTQNILFLVLSFILRSF